MGNLDFHPHQGISRYLNTCCQEGIIRGWVGIFHYYWEVLSNSTTTRYQWRPHRNLGLIFSPGHNEVPLLLSSVFSSDIKGDLLGESEHLTLISSNKANPCVLSVEAILGATKRHSYSLQPEKYEWRPRGESELSPLPISNE